MPAVTKGGNQPLKGGTGSGKGKKAPSKTTSKGGNPHKSGKGSVGTAGHKKKRSHKKKARWNLFVHRLLKRLHGSQLSISSRAMTIMGSLVEDFFNRIQRESCNIVKINDKKTLTAREVQTAARLLLPKELAKLAMSEGTRAVAKYNASQGKDPSGADGSA
eukprot:284303_1